MPELNLLPSNLDIKCVAGDDVQIVATFISDYGCTNTVTDISGMTFAAEFKVGTTVYNATISVETATGKVTITWTDTQTAASGAGVYKWFLTVTEGDITKTRLAGNFQVVSRN